MSPSFYRHGLMVALLVGALQGSPRAQESPSLPRGVCAILGLPEPGRADSVLTMVRDGTRVYFQTPVAADLAAVRRAADHGGLLGKAVFAELGDFARIHLADNIADRVIVSPSARQVVSHAEVLRVLCPEGQADLDGVRLFKPMPAGVDAWPQPFHGPDNNPQSADQLARTPYLTQFLSFPQFCPMPEVTVAAGGRLFKAFGHIAHKANQNAALNTLMAVNGYNGAILWTRPLREGFMIHRNTWIATPEALYFGDDESCKALDARTGKLVREIVVPDGVGDGKVWKWMSLEAGVLCALVGGEEVRPKTQPSGVLGLGHWPWGLWEGHEYKDPKSNFGYGRTFLAIQPASGRILWQHHEQDYIDGRGVCMKNGRIYYYSPAKFLACLDAKGGRVLWRNEDADLLDAIGPPGRAQNPTQGYATTCFIKCNDRYVFFAGPQRPNVVVASAADGKLVWRRKDGNLHLILREDCFYAVGPGGAKFAYDTWEALTPLPGRRACTRATGSLDSIFYRAAEGTVHLNTAESDRAQHIALMRPPCQDGVIIANGMLYWGPWMCGCPLSFYGHIGLAPAGGFIFRPGADGRLAPGEGSPSDVTKLQPAPGDWPTWCGDNARSFLTTAPLPQQVRQAWTCPTGRTGRTYRVTGPVTAGGLAFVGDDSGALRAISAADGQVRWETHASGAIFYPPSVWNGRLFVGSADGRAYAFEAATGRRLWTFRAAPTERWIHVFGSLMSTWPVAGGVVVEPTTDGQAAVYFAAGMAHYDGTHVYALDAVTGRLLWHNDSSGLLSEQVRSGISLQGEVSVRNGELRFHGGGAYESARYDLKTGRCLNEPVHALGSRFATAFYPFYPAYGQFVSLRHRLSDGRVLSFEVIYEGSRHVPLALFEAPPPGQDAPPPGWRVQLRRPGEPPPTWKAAWEDKRRRNFNAFAVNHEIVVAAGQSRSSEPPRATLTAFAIADGRELWEVELPAPAVKGGLATDRDGSVLAVLNNGALLAFEAVR